MERQMILELLLKDKSHDELIELPELYSIEEEIYQWLFETKDELVKSVFSVFRTRKRNEIDEAVQEESEGCQPNRAFECSTVRIRKVLRRYYRMSCSFQRICLREDIVRFWRELLRRRPEFAERCPWHFFRWDVIWQTLQDDEFCKAIGIPKKELALKMPLKLMSPCDWDELLKAVPELKPYRDRLTASRYIVATVTLRRRL